MRVRGVNTPEIRGRCEWEKQRAIQARDYVRGLLIGKHVQLISIENDVYGGRVLATVWLENGKNLAEELVLQGYDRAYDGRRRLGWC